MKLFLSMLLLLAVSSFGAQPSYTVFRGSGGITVTTNPPNGLIIIDGSGVTTGTNAAAPPFGSIQFNSNGVMRGNINFQFTNNGVRLGLNGAVLTNILSTTATLDFPQLEFGGAADLPVTLAGVSDGDVCEVSAVVASIGPVNVVYTAFASNNTVYVRCASYAVGQNPASGTFRVVAKKFQ